MVRGEAEAQGGGACAFRAGSLTHLTLVGTTPQLVVHRRLDTLEQAELQYKKKEKKKAPEGWDVFNSKALYDAYLKRADKVGGLSCWTRRGWDGRMRSTHTHTHTHTPVALTNNIYFAKDSSAQPGLFCSPQIPYTQEEYEAARARDPELFDGKDGLQYGKVADLPAKNVDNMVNELTER